MRENGLLPFGKLKIRSPRKPWSQKPVFQFLIRTFFVHWTWGLEYNLHTAFQFQYQELNSSCKAVVSEHLRLYRCYLGCSTYLKLMKSVSSDKLFSPWSLFYYVFLILSLSNHCGKSLRYSCEAEVNSAKMWFPLMYVTTEILLLV